MNRREFLKTSAFASATGLLVSSDSAGQVFAPKNIDITLQAGATPKTTLALRELSSGLRLLNPAFEVTQGTASEVSLTLAIDRVGFRGAEEYEITAVDSGTILRAASEQALLFAVFDFLERQGLVFGIDGPTAPVDRPADLRLPTRRQGWIGSPCFVVRGLLPWPDFLNCISVYNEEDFHAYFAAMLRMRFNMFGMHVYTNNEPGPLAESYLSFDFAGSGHRAALEDTTSISWGYLPQRTSTFKMGASDFFDRETFGSDAVRLSADNWEIAERTTAMLHKALTFASDLGIRTGIGFEPYQNPEEIVRALPPEALSSQRVHRVAHRLRSSRTPPG